MLKGSSSLSTPVSIANGGTFATSSNYSTNGVIAYDGTRFVSTTGFTYDWINSGISFGVNALRATPNVHTSGSLTINSNVYSYHIINKTVGSATSVTLPPPTTGVIIVIKDGKGDAATNNITITSPSSKTIDGAASYVINSNYGKVTLYYNGTEWNVI